MIIFNLKYCAILAKSNLVAPNRLSILIVFCLDVAAWVTTHVLLTVTVILAVPIILLAIAVLLTISSVLLTINSRSTLTIATGVHLVAGVTTIVGSRSWLAAAITAESSCLLLCIEGDLTVGPLSRLFIHDSLLLVLLSGQLLLVSLSFGLLLSQIERS